jgi:diguanylate cyclase (GGDEF)-like protein
MRRIAAGAGLLAAGLLVLGTADTILTGHPGGTLGDPRHVAVFALATLLIVLHQLTAPAGHRVWSAFAAGALLSLVAKGLWAFGDGDATTARTAEVVYAFSYLAYGVGLSLFLHRRVGDALRTFSLDALGIAMYVLTIGAAVLLAPITRHSGQGQGIVVLHLLYPAADAAICSVIFGVSSFTGRRKGDQDRLLGAAFLTMCAADLGYLAGLAGWVHGLTPWMYLLSELALLLIAAAAWARPSTAGALRVGGWWEATPTLSWTVAGGGVLVAAWAFHLPGAVVALACGTLVLAAVRGLRVVREVRDLVVVRAESLVDDLTGLANQRALFAQLDLVTREQGSDGRCVSLLIFDLDGFHELTDTLGHEVAGRLLRAVGTRLEGVVCSTLARLEGDQFATVVEDRDPVTVAAELTAALAAPLSLEGIAVSVRPVVGYARFPRDAVTPTGLARRADVARRDAKARGLAVVAYDPERDGHSRERLALAADLRAALETRGGGGLWLAFQPQVALATGEVHGAEALLRWCHPTRGELSPAEVLPVAERSGQMSALTDWVLEHAVAQIAALQARGVVLPISMNVSAVTLVDAGLPERISAMLKRYRVRPELLVVEVTEDAVMRDRRRCLDVLEHIAALGVQISIDDFGTGQSSLGQLRHLPADELKIDRRFVNGMADDPLDGEIVRLVIALGARMGVRVVAEGIETEAEHATLAELGCDVVQGFGIGRPVPASGLWAWLVRAEEPARIMRRSFAA